MGKKSVRRLGGDVIVADIYKKNEWHDEYYQGNAYFDFMQLSDQGAPFHDDDNHHWYEEGLNESFWITVVRRTTTTVTIYGNADSTLWKCLTFHVRARINASFTLIKAVIVRAEVVLFSDYGIDAICSAG